LSLFDYRGINYEDNECKAAAYLAPKGCREQ